SVEKIAGGSRETYRLEPLGRVRVTIVEDLVELLAIVLDKPAEADTLAERLRINDVEPVEVFDVNGRLQGRSYPEHGVLLGFADPAPPPRVLQVVIEQIDAQPFIARAEVRLSSRYGDCLSDLSTAFQLDPRDAHAQRLHAELARRAGELDTALA